MGKVQSEVRSVDREGRVLVNRASRCELRTRSTVPLAPSGTKTPVGRSVRRRFVMHVKHHVVSGFGVLLTLGGDGVDSTTGYPLLPGAEIRLPLTVRVIAQITGSTQDSAARLLEHG